MKKHIVFLVLIGLVFSQNLYQSPSSYLTKIQSRDFYTCIYFGLDQKIYSLPIVKAQGYNYIKSKFVYEVKSFDEYKDSGDQTFEQIYEYKDGILSEVYGYHAVNNNKMTDKKCKWIGEDKIECNEINYSFLDDKAKFNFKEIYKIQPLKNKIIIQRFIELGLIEEITLLFNKDFQLLSIKKEKFPDITETHDDNDSKKYSLITFGDELVKINFNRSYFSGDLKSISEKKAYTKDSRMKDSTFFDNFAISENLISNFMGIFEWEEADIKMGGSGTEIQFIDSSSKSKIHRTSSYLSYKTKGRSSDYYFYFR